MFAGVCLLQKCLVDPVPQIEDACEEFKCYPGYEAWIWLNLTTRGGRGKSFELQAMKDFSAGLDDAQSYLDEHVRKGGDGTIDIDRRTGDARLVKFAPTSVRTWNLQQVSCFFDPEVLADAVGRGEWPSPAGT